MLDFTCPTCGKNVQGDESLAGKYVLCPVCNIAMTAPQTTPKSIAAITAHRALTPQAESSDGAFCEGLPPLDAPLPPVREAASHS